jgi:tetratricopeptide (TPR) repeat protein
LIHYSLERYQEALDDFDAAFAVNPGNPKHLYFRARILENLERNIEARRTWQVALSLFKEAGDEIKVAECLARLKRLD